jgi:hypothetical protein
MSLRNALARLRDLAGAQHRVARQAFREALSDILDAESNREPEPGTARC